MINLDLFSYSMFNSYIVFSLKDDVLHIRNVIDGDENYSTLATLDLKANNITDVNCELGCLTLSGPEQQIRITYLDIDRLIINAKNPYTISYTPKKYEFASKIADTIWNINLYSNKSKMLIISQQPISVNQEWNVISSDILEVKLQAGTTNIAISSDSFSTDYYQLKNGLDLAIRVIEQHFLDFWNLEKIDYTDSGFESRYIIWSGFVAAKGNLKYDACYMSKNIMTNIWSWDNCFVSLALAKEQPRRAYEQFMSFYHVQSEAGNFPDFMNPFYVSYDFTKPPVQGVLYKQLMKINYEFFTEDSRLEEVLDSFKKLVNYWTVHRTFNGIHKLPYNTHGNDTGLDNATVFEDAVEIRTPDLFVYLIKLMELINELEAIKGIEETDYSSTIDSFEHELKTVMYNGEKFESYNVHNQAVNDDSMSILELIPLLVAERFDQQILDKLIANVDNFHTSFGIASEAPASKYYREDGYWRGPIWAPTTCLVYLGLVTAEQFKLATEVKESYMRMCEQYGYAENFNALTGCGLSDKSFAWTAAVYKFFKDINE